MANAERRRSEHTESDTPPGVNNAKSTAPVVQVWQFIVTSQRGILCYRVYLFTGTSPLEMCFVQRIKSHTHTRTHARTTARTRTHAHSHARAHAHSHAHTHTHTHTHIYTHRRVGGFNVVFKCPVVFKYTV